MLRPFFLAGFCLFAWNIKTNAIFPVFAGRELCRGAQTGELLGGLRSRGRAASRRGRTFLKQI
jgi:hypothetical protein